MVAPTTELEREKRILEVLNRTGARLASELDLQSLVQMVTDAATEVTTAEFGSFFYTVTDAQGDAWQLYTLSGAPREAFAHLGLPRATHVFGPTFRGEGIVRSDDITKDPRYGRMGAPHHGMPKGHLPVCSYLAVPVISRTGEVIGGLFFGHSKPGVFTEEAERVVVGIAAQAAIAIDNARLFEQVKASSEERAKLLDLERAARTEVERVSTMKDEFLATLSHELRTPLNAVLGWSEMLLSRAPDDPELRRGLETIVRNARAQSQLIEDLLDMNRIVSGKIRLDVQRVDIAAIVEAAIDTARPSAEAKSLRIRTTLDPDPGAVFGDPHRLQQVVWNLLTNAIKFTPKDGTVDIVLARVRSHIEITVQDTGAGISPEFIPHLFERFRQADSSTTRKYGGLGLGLSIVKQLVELHGGTVHATSPGLNLGATFVVTLPLRAVRSETPNPTGRHPIIRRHDISLSGLTVLLVEDETDSRELLAALLEQAGAIVLVASNATDALSLLKAHQPSILVSDIGMPDRDGYQLIGDVRALPPNDGGRTPAIALTAFARSEDRTRAMLAGFQAHLSKPAEPVELMASIRSLARV